MPIVIRHNGALANAASGLAGGLGQGLEIGMQQRRMQLAEAESQANTELAKENLRLRQEQAEREATLAGEQSALNQERIGQMQRARRQEDAYTKGLGILDELRQARGEWDQSNGPVGEAALGPESHVQNILGRLNEVSSQMSPEARASILQEKGHEMSMRVLAEDAKRQAQRAMKLAQGQGPTEDGTPTGILQPDQAEGLVSGMESFIKTGGQQGLNPIEVGTMLSKLETEQAQKAAFAAEGQRMLMNLSTQHAGVAQMFPGMRMLRSHAALSLISMRSPQTQGDLDAMQGAYMKALADDLSESSKLQEQMIQTQGTVEAAGLRAAGQRSAANKPYTYDDAVGTARKELGDLATGEDIQKRAKELYDERNPKPPPTSDVLDQAAQMIAQGNDPGSVFTNLGIPNDMRYAQEIKSRIDAGRAASPKAQVQPETGTKQRVDATKQSNVLDGSGRGEYQDRKNTRQYIDGPAAGFLANNNGARKQSDSRNLVSLAETLAETGKVRAGGVPGGISRLLNKWPSPPKFDSQADAREWMSGQLQQAMDEYESAWGSIPSDILAKIENLRREFIKEAVKQ